MPSGTSAKVYPDGGRKVKSRYESRERPLSSWSLNTLQSALIRHRIVRSISLDYLRRILLDAGVSLRDTQRHQLQDQSANVG